MRTRPLGITILSLLSFLNVAVYATLATLSIVNPRALSALLRGLSPGGSGPADLHFRMGSFLPLFYILAGVAIGFVALGFWKLWNWARLAMLALIGLSLVGLVTVEAKGIPSGGAAALGLFVLRLGLCLLIGWYLLSRKVHAAFPPQSARQPEPHATSESVSCGN